jgi:hypothetical protein
VGRSAARSDGLKQGLRSRGRAPTDADIDALVYELCRLTEEEIAIVEGPNH